ncbi:MAG: DNA primase [Gammaproteobacteria bacterium]|nr:DNA primase [Gammaproteobacteria bacterium]
MTAEVLLSRLEKVRQTGRDTWVALCPAHDDTRPSLAIRGLSDGQVLLFCRSRDCAVEDIVAAVGLTMAVLFPDRPTSPYSRPQRHRWPPADLLRMAGRDARVVGIGALMMTSGDPLSEVDRQCILDAATRLIRTADEAG